VYEYDKQEKEKGSRVLIIIKYNIISNNIGLEEALCVEVKLCGKTYYTVSHPASSILRYGRN
jgi:hypothetical protein